MQKSKIKQAMKTGSNTWKDKELTKFSVEMENGDVGTLTIGFGDNDKIPEIGDELEYDLETSEKFGNEIKPKRDFKGGGGFGAKKWTPEQIAQEGATKIVCAFASSGVLPMEDYKLFFVECKAFLVTQASETKVEAEADKLPF